MTPAMPPQAEPSDAARLATRQRTVLHLDRYTTRITLIAPAEGTTRFVGGAVFAANARDRGVAAAQDYLSMQTGERVREADAAILARPPLRLLAVGEPDVSAGDALATIAALGIARVAEQVTPPRGAEREAHWAAGLIARVAAREADVLLLTVPPGRLVGWCARLLNAIHALPPDAQPPCIVRGGYFSLTTLLPPSAQVVPESGDLTAAYTDAFARIAAADAGLPRLPKAVLFRIPALVTALIATERVLGAPLLYLDVSEGSTAILTTGGQAKVYHDAATDTGAGAPAVLARVGVEGIRRWLPFAVEGRELRAWAVRRAAWPAATPLTPRDHALTAAFAREAARPLVAAAGMAAETCGACVLGPGAATWGTPGQLMLTAVDIVPFAGPVPLAHDADDLLAAIGWLARESPEGAAALFTQDALTNLGTAIPVFGTGSARETALRVALDTPTAEHETHAVRWGTLLRLPAPDGPVALHTQGRGDAAFQTLRAQGGSGGLLIDARGRPLLVAPDREAQREHVRGWFAALDGTPGPRR